MKFGTKAIHAGLKPDPATGAIMTPVYQTSTYVQASPGDHKGYEYSRTQNPTRHALERNLAALENAKHGLAFASGLAATDAVMKTLKAGDEIISTNDLYGGTYRLFTKIFEGYGLKFHFVEMTSLEKVKSLLSDKTRMIWVETPTNPMMNIIDIRGIADLIKGRDITLVVDNTFCSPYLQNPIDHGADVVMHSVTKYLAGHSDVVMGALMLNDDELHEKLAFVQNASGAVPGPQDCFLVLRGNKTLHVRMQRHCENGSVIANYLKNHNKVDKVYWPGFADHPGYEIAKKQMRGFGGMISFIMKNDSIDCAYKILKRFRLFSLAESLGGVESLSGHPASMTHASIPREKRLQSGLKDSLIRLSVGIEDIEDLTEDLKQAIG